MEERQPKIGEPVVYVDPVRVAHAAIITAVHGRWCTNVVLVSTDATKTDSYGRQIERQTSCVHQQIQEAPGNYWRYLDDAPKPTELTA
jgi:hypothetical protein